MKQKLTKPVGFFGNYCCHMLFIICNVSLKHHARVEGLQRSSTLGFSHCRT